MEKKLEADSRVPVHACSLRPDVSPPFSFTSRLEKACSWLVKLSAGNFIGDERDSFLKLVSRVTRCVPAQFRGRCVVQSVSPMD